MFSEFRILACAGVMVAAMTMAATAQAADRPSAFAVCGTCHKTAPGETSVLGPNLFGIIGREAGTNPEFANFSEPMKTSGIIWTPEILDEYLRAPQEVVPGTTMAFPGMRNDRTRTAIVEYLETLK